MKNRTSRNFLAPLLFFLAALYFLTLHFIKMDGFSGVVGNINYEGQRTIGSLLAPAKIKKMNVSFNGIDFNFSLFSKLIITTSDSINHPLTLQDYIIENDRITLKYNKNVSLIFISDIHSKKVTLLPNLPLTIPPINEVTLPAKTLPGFSLEQEEASELYRLTMEEENYYITIPTDTELDLKKGSIYLNVSNNIIKSIVLEETLSGTGRSLHDWYDNEGTLLNNTIYRTSLNQYLDSCIQSLQNHLDTRTGLIAKNDDSNSSYFSEDALASFVVGAIPRGQYNSVVSMLGSGVSRQSSQMTYFSSPFFDDIVNKGNALMVEDWRKSAKYQDSLTRRDPNLFNEKNLVDYFGSQYDLYKLIPELFEFSTVGINNDDDFESLIGRLDIQLNYLSNFPDQNREGSVEKIIEILNSRTFWIKDDLLLFDNQGIAQIESTLIFGQLLIDYSQILNDEKLLASGWKFILSCLKYSDINGYLPQQIVYSNQSDPEKEGSLPPEYLYMLLNESSYNPRRMSLKNQLGAGAWAFTASSKLSVQSTPRETVINVDFPIGSEHYFIIRGVSPFHQLSMHNTAWKSDSSFQRYSDGWVYDKAKNTLFIKIKHRRATETIKLTHYVQTEETTPPVSPENGTTE